MKKVLKRFVGGLLCSILMLESIEASAGEYAPAETLSAEEFSVEEESAEELAAEDASFEASDEAAREISVEVSEEVQENTDDVSEDASEETTEEASDASSDEAVQEATDEASLEDSEILEIVEDQSLVSGFTVLGIFNGGNYRYDPSNCILELNSDGALPDYGKSDRRPYDEYLAKAKKIIVTDGVTRIGNYDFAYAAKEGAAGIQVEIADSVTEIGEYAFEGMKLSKVKLPSNLQRVEKFAFSETGGTMSNSSFPEGVTYFGDNAFKGFTVGQKIKFSPEVTYIGEAALRDAGVSIDSYDLSGLTKLTTIGTGAFITVEAPKSNLVFPESLTNIGNGAFNGCINVVGELKLPGSVTSIGIYTFKSTGISSVVFHDKIGSIGWDAFGDCNQLTSAVFEGSLPETNGMIFDGSKGPIEVIYNAAEDSWSDIGPDNLGPFGGTTVTFKPYGEVTAEFYGIDGQIIEKQAVKCGEKVKKPTLSADDEAGIEAWCYDTKTSDKLTWNFEDPLYHNIKLYPARKTFVVLFFVDGSDPAGQLIKYGDSATDCSMIFKKEGFEIGGWYLDEKYTKPYDLATPVKGDLRLYGPWKCTLEDTDGIVETDRAGIWVDGVPEKLNYDGTAKTLSQMKVYYGKLLLKSGRDYAVTYTLNRNAGTGKAVIKFRGSYSNLNPYIQEFRIEPCGLIDLYAEGNLTLNTEHMTMKYADYVNKVRGEKTKGLLRIKAKLAGKNVNLAEGRDFYCIWDSSIELGEEAHSAETRIYVYGTGNYKGSFAIPLTVYNPSNVVSLSNVSVAKIPDQIYDPEMPATPSITLKYKGKELVEGWDYDVVYRNNSSIGTATAFITAGESGNLVGERKVTFKIVGTSIRAAKIDKLPAVTYWGSTIGPELHIIYKGKELMGEFEEEFTKDMDAVDYICRYENNINAGYGKVTITGVNGFTGSITKTYKINSFNIANEDDYKIVKADSHEYARILANSAESIVVFMQDKRFYMPGGAKQMLSVYFWNYQAGEYELLKEGTDYALSYSNNTRVGSVATVKITGKKNFTGTLTGTFEVCETGLNECYGTGSDVTLLKSGRCYGKPVVVIRDYITDVKLAEKKDYVISKYIKADDRSVVDLKKDIIPAGTELIAVVEGKGNFTGTKEVPFKAVVNTMNKLKVTVSDQRYSGGRVVPSKSDIRINMGTTMLTEDDFEIDYCYNNIRVGTATVVIKGKGIYGGQKAVRFKIKP